MGTRFKRCRHTCFALQALIRIAPIFSSHQALEKEEAELYQSKDDILKQSQRLTASFLEQKGELEGSTRRAEERARIVDRKLSALQEELGTARCGLTDVLILAQFSYILFSYEDQGCNFRPFCLLGCTNIHRWVLVLCFGGYTRQPPV